MSRGNASVVTDSDYQCTCCSLWRLRGSADAPWPLTSCTLVYSCLQRRQEEGYYSRLEAERRRQHDEAARRLLEPEDPGLSRPPLPRDYEPPSLSPAPGAPPPPPQRNASYLKTQVLSPDSLFTAKFVAYDDEEEEDCGPAGQDKYPSTRKSHEHLPLAALKPQQPRPASDGIFLSNSFQPPLAKANSTANKAGQPPPPPGKPSFYRPGHWKGRGKRGIGESDLSCLDDWAWDLCTPATWYGTLRPCLSWPWVLPDHSKHVIYLPLPVIVVFMLMLR